MSEAPSILSVGATNAKIEKSWGDVLAAARDHHASLVNEGIVDDDSVRMTVTARKKAVATLHEQGFSQRKIAKVVGASHTTVQNDLAGNLLPDNGKSLPPNTRELLSQSDQNDWRTPQVPGCGTCGNGGDLQFIF